MSRLIPLKYSLKVLTTIHFTGFCRCCLVAFWFHYVAPANLQPQTHCDLLILASRTISTYHILSWNYKHLPQPVLCSVSHHNVKRAQRAGPRGSSRGGCSWRMWRQPNRKECPSHQEQHVPRPWLGRNLVPCLISVESNKSSGVRGPRSGKHR